MASVNTLRFGIEVEVLILPKRDLGLRSKGGQVMNIRTTTEFAEAWNKTTDDERFHLHLKWPPYGDIKKEHAHPGWWLSRDLTINTPRETEHLGLEFISSILTFKNHAHEYWIIIEDFWKRLASLSTICQEQSTGIHIHVSPADDEGWTIDRVKRVATASLWFEPALKAIMPDHRRGNAHCLSNYLYNSKFYGKSIEYCLERIDGCRDKEELLKLMKGEYVARDWTWNFTNLQETAKQTIEFRQPPGVTNVNGCFAWTEMTLRFVSASLRWAVLGKMKSWTRNISGLREFLDSGAIAGGVYNLESNGDEYILQGKVEKKEPKFIGQIGEERRALAKTKREMEEESKKKQEIVTKEDVPKKEREFSERIRKANQEIKKRLSPIPEEGESSSAGKKKKPKP